MEERKNSLKVCASPDKKIYRKTQTRKTVSHMRTTFRLIMIIEC